MKKLSQNWDDKNGIKLFTCGTYMIGKPDGEMQNVKKICLFSTYPGYSGKESELADRIETIEEELHYPKYFNGKYESYDPVNKHTGRYFL